MKSTLLAVMLVFVFLSDACAKVDGDKLQWQPDADDKMTWEEAMEYCEESDFQSYNDWRVPDINELIVISSDKDTPPPARLHDSKYYWSSNVYTNFAKAAWFANLDDNYQHFLVKNYKIYVRCVRTKVD